MNYCDQINDIIGAWIEGTLLPLEVACSFYVENLVVLSPQKIHPLQEAGQVKHVSPKLLEGDSYR